MSDNVKDIRKKAELLGMKPEVLIDKGKDNEQYQKIITSEIKLDFEEKLNKLAPKFKIPPIKKQENQVVVVGMILFFLIFLFCCLIVSGFTETFMTNKIKQNVSETKQNVSETQQCVLKTEQYILTLRLVIVIFILTTLMLSILIFAGMFCKIIYNWITETKSPQRYEVEEMIKIFELIEKQEKY